VVESVVVDPAQMRASAEKMVGILVDLRFNLNNPDGIMAVAHSRIPFGENNPSGHVYDLRVQAQEALQRAQRNLVVQAGQIKKIIDSILAAIVEYEGIDAAADEQLKKLTDLMAEIEGTEKAEGAEGTKGEAPHEQK
jgi:hypothetical protein